MTRQNQSSTQISQKLKATIRDVKKMAENVKKKAELCRDEYGGHYTNLM